MAFPYEELKTQLADIRAVGGFDKELQLALIKKRDASILSGYCRDLR